jgi:hypothetical protein
MLDGVTFVTCPIVAPVEYGDKGLRSGAAKELADKVFALPKPETDGSTAILAANWCFCLGEKIPASRWATPKPALFVI